VLLVTPKDVVIAGHTHSVETWAVPIPAETLPIYTSQRTHGIDAAACPVPRVPITVSVHLNAVASDDGGAKMSLPAEINTNFKQDYRPMRTSASIQETTSAQNGASGTANVKWIELNATNKLMLW
jgi:hypothetical protein